MPLAHSDGPRWFRSQNVSNDERLRGFGLIREFLARIFGRRWGRETARAARERTKP